MENLKHILDLTYELEGLVELALRRTNAHEALIPLIVNKVSALSHAAVVLRNAPEESQLQHTPESPDAETLDYPEPDAGSDATHFTPPSTPLPESFPDAPQPAPRVIGHLPLSINDKFRFRRELFGDDNTRYLQALEIIATMSTMEEVLDYLCNDLELEEESPEVQAFLERIRSLASL